MDDTQVGEQGVMHRPRAGILLQCERRVDDGPDLFDQGFFAGERHPVYAFGFKPRALLLRT